MLWCKLLRSPHPHARIVSIDASRAVALPGVEAVITGADLPIPFGILPVSQDEHALCPDVVRFVGDPVAAVAAVDEETALAACGLIDVVYEPLPVIGSVDDAAATPAPSSTATPTRATGTSWCTCSSGSWTKASGAPTWCGRTCSSTRATPTCRWSSTPASRTPRPTGASPSGPAPRRPTTCTAPSRRCSTCRRRGSESSPRRTAAASAARAIRSTTRSWWPS